MNMLLCCVGGANETQQFTEEFTSSVPIMYSYTVRADSKKKRVTATGVLQSQTLMQQIHLELSVK